jgi:ankyrin repeat protein
MDEFGKLIEAVKRGSVEDVEEILGSRPELVHERDESGATVLHFAAFEGHRAVAELLIRLGAQINVFDARFGATPTGWAIEYLREMGGFLAIELDDFAYAIRRADVEWMTRFLRRFPSLREASEAHGNSFKVLADQSGNAEIMRLFESQPTI